MDIVERLRNGTGNNPENHWLLIEAADEIERLWEAAKDRPKDRPNEAADEIERLREAIRVQANAAKTLVAVKEEHIRYYRERERQEDEAIATLDSEREANAILTTEIERLQRCCFVADVKIERLKEAINKTIKKMEGKGMGDWPEAKILLKALKEGE